MMNESLTIKLKTLTPLWTGGVKTGTMDCIHDTAIIGSLRWWYEAVMRGLGADVCNPTANDPLHRCHFDTVAYQRALQDKQDKGEALQLGLQNVCPVCRLFGCTGWKRRFDLSAEVHSDHLVPMCLATLNQSGKFNHWWLSQVFQVNSSNIYFGDLPVRVRFMRGYEYYEKVFIALLSIMANYGALGAKGQYGFGLFTFAESYPIGHCIDTFRSQITTPAIAKNLVDNFYSLNDFWCLQCQIPDSDQQVKKFQQATIIGNASVFGRHKNCYLPVSFDIRYKLPNSSDGGLRQAYRLAHGKKETRQVFGTVQSEEQKWGSRLNVSHLYKTHDSDRYYQLRVWGFTSAEVRQEIVSILRSMFQQIIIHVTNDQTILNMTDKTL